MPDAPNEDLTRQLQHPGPTTAHAPTPTGGSAEVVSRNGDRYAAEIERVEVTHAAPVADLGAAAERIARQVDVVGPLQPWEIAPGEQAILRSTQPTTDAEGVGYWEATVTSDRTTVQPWHKNHADPDREPAPEPLLHRDVGKLTDQLSRAVEPDNV